MKLPSKILFVDEKLQNAFESLENGKGDERELYKFIDRAFNDIEGNAFCGIQIPKKQIPKEYIKKYDVKNLWKYDLPTGWRLIYSIESNQVIVISIVLEWMDHKNYERTFNY